MYFHFRHSNSSNTDIYIIQKIYSRYRWFSNNGFNPHSHLTVEGTIQFSRQVSFSAYNNKLSPFQETISNLKFRYHSPKCFGIINLIQNHELLQQLGAQSNQFQVSGIKYTHKEYAVNIRDKTCSLVFSPVCLIDMLHHLQGRELINYRADAFCGLYYAYMCPFL